MTLRIRTTLTIIAFLAVASSMTICADEPVLDLALDGKSFEGELKVDKGLFKFIRVDETVSFNDGLFIWASGGEDGYKPSPYTTKQSGGKVIFTAHVARNEGDYTDWTGVYDGESLSNVTAVWTRLEKDFVHDLLLPEEVSFTFIPAPTEGY